MRAMALLILTLATSSVFAGGVGNGGDACENRFQVVRDDIRSWITSGGSAALSLPQRMTLEQYNSLMLRSIGAAKISCVDNQIYIGTAEKTCKNFVDSQGISQIQCNTARFLQTPEDDQYVLVHHEYAGLSGLEVNNGEESTYSISNQISEYLEVQMIKKLVVKRPPPIATGELAPDLFLAAQKACLIGVVGPDAHGQESLDWQILSQLKILAPDTFQQILGTNIVANGDEIGWGCVSKDFVYQSSLTT
jgi:hypothetical protein